MHGSRRLFSPLLLLKRRAREVDELRGEKAQLEMQLVVACVAAIVVVVSQVSSRAT